MDKLIFSRKGFDSSAGYGYSPYDPKSGKYIVLPIPGDVYHKQGYKYEDLLLKENFLEGMNAENLRDLINDPKMGYSKKSKEIIKNSYVHYDPVLGESPWLSNGPRCGAFGQAGSAAGHLRNHNVKEGTIFLFFSRFKPMKASVHPLDPRGAWTEGAYYIYGWLKVGKVIDVNNKEELPGSVKEQHPHGSDADFQKRKYNTIYLASKKLFDDMDIPGCGYFPKLTDELLLSSKQHKNKPSIWKLPSFFHEEKYRPTYLNVENKLEERWFMCPEDEGYCYVQSTGRGQEYISRLEDQSLKWLRTLFSKAY
ncbi:hypothetical protein [Halobacillus sp. Marseille-Q1614]|uniref:Nmad3 family putative nucleotide modification protein n=1 Tax=Halobacillus sp. Marseille-Q1614 TaxID=2709134 RepID=UPI00156FEDF0|nr:hypothetical protein [Halobacillus sp. Marseille-Q1614]